MRSGPNVSPYCNQGMRRLAGSALLALALLAMRLRLGRQAATTAASTPTTQGPGGVPAAARRSAPAGEPDPARRARRLREADRALRGLPDRRQRMGVVVRPLPVRVPDPAEALGALRKAGRLSRRRQRGLRRRRPHLPLRGAGALSELCGPDQSIKDAPRRDPRRAGHRLLRPSGASSSTSSRAPTPSRGRCASDIERCALAEGMR